MEEGAKPEGDDDVRPDRQGHHHSEGGEKADPGPQERAEDRAVPAVSVPQPVGVDPGEGGEPEERHHQHDRGDDERARPARRVAPGRYVAGLLVEQLAQRGLSSIT
jgi:hypothetical protein